MAEIQFAEIRSSIRVSNEEFIKGCDLEYKKAVNSVADIIEKNGIRTVLLAGPSGSGKTTTANILKDCLSGRRHEVIVVSLDDFYRDKKDPAYPKDENGEQDYESVEALNIKKIKDCFEGLFKGNEIIFPTYVFKDGAAHYNNAPIHLADDGIVIVEGLHALNPIITEDMDLGKVIRVFVSVSTNVYDENDQILSGRDIRFVRRTTRDAIYRNTSANSTLERWGSVIKGEDKYLYPYRDTADVSIDTFHKYELSIMKPFWNNAIDAENGSLTGEYLERIKSIIDEIEEIDASLLSRDSLIREFVPLY